MNIDKLLSMQHKIPVKQCVTLADPLDGIWENTVLSKAFFSQANINIIQNAIRAGVYYKSNRQYTIAPQDCEVLQVIMQSIFLNNSLNQPNDITKQIVALNNLVVKYAVNQIYEEVVGYMKYRKDIASTPIPLQYPVATNKSKQLMGRITTL